MITIAKEHLRNRTLEDIIESTHVKFPGEDVSVHYVRNKIRLLASRDACLHWVRTELIRHLDVYPTKPEMIELGNLICKLWPDLKSGVIRIDIDSLMMIANESVDDLLRLYVLYVSNEVNRVLKKRFAVKDFN